MQTRHCLVSMAAAWIAAGALIAPSARATNYSWISASGGSASTAGFWNPTGIPGALDNAIFGPNAGYNVSWGSPADTLASMLVSSGRPRFNMSPADPLGIQGQLLVQAESLSVLGGLLRCGHLVVGSGGTGNLLLSGTGTMLTAAGNTGSYIGDGGNGTLWVQGAAKLDSYGFLTLGFAPGDQCTATVIGGNFLQHVFSGLLTRVASAGAQGDLTVGNQGQATLHFQNGGFGDIAGDLFIGRNSGGNGTVDISNTVNGVGSPSLTVHGITDVGNNDSPGSQAGDGHLTVSHGTASLLGHANIAGGSVTVSNGAALNASGGVTMWMHSPRGPEPPLLTSTGAGHANVGSSFVIGDGSTRLTDGPETIPVHVDAGSFLDYTGANPLIIDTDGLLQDNGVATSAAEIRNAGFITLAGGTLQAPLVHGIQKDGFSGYLEGFGTVNGRVRLEPNAELIAQGGNLTVGDSTASDGFSSSGLSAANSVTLTVLDLDGADLNRVVLNGGPATAVLNLPRGGRTTDQLVVPTGPAEIDGSFINDGLVHLDGQLAIAGHMTQFNGTTDGSAFLTINSGATLSARGSIAGPVILNGTLDFGVAPAGLGVGTFQANSGSTSRFRLGPSAGAQRDSLVVGNMFLAGALDLVSGPAGFPAPGDTVTIIRVTGAYSGAFGSVTENGIPAAGHVSVIYDPKAVRVVRLDATGVTPRPGFAAAALRFAATGSLQRPAFALDLPWPARARVTLFDVAGRTLATLADGPLPAGRHQLPVPLAALPSGIYFGRATIEHTGGSRVLQARMVCAR